MDDKTAWTILSKPSPWLTDEAKEAIARGADAMAALATLRAELADARERLATAESTLELQKSNNDRLLKEWAASIAELDAALNRNTELNQRLATAGADSRRLDWLESRGLTTHDPRDRHEIKPMGVHSWYCSDEQGEIVRWTARYIRSDYKTLRAAIDAAGGQG